MNEFKNELKRRCDVEFSRIKSKYRSKVNKKGTIESVANNLKTYKDMLMETTDRITAVANKLHPEMEVTKDEATSELQSLLKKYMGDIKKTSGF